MLVVRNRAEIVKSPLIICPRLYHEVETEFKSLKLDCSSGYGRVPVNLVKLISVELCSPLPHVYNCGVEHHSFRTSWKVGKIEPFSKIDNPISKEDFRPVSVLPILSKIYERIVCKQSMEYIEVNNIYKEPTSGF